MKCNHLVSLAFLLFNSFFFTSVKAQTIVDGYVFEANNRGPLNQVKVTVFELPDNIVRGEVETSLDGHFVFSLPDGKYRVLASSDIFIENYDTINLGKENIFLKIELLLRPGYRFGATITEVRESPDQIVDAINGATIEIYNRTSHQPELTISPDTDASFNFTFERGNHYTMLIRKEGFLTRRIEVYVNVNSCIFCVSGIHEISPEAIKNLTTGNKTDALLVNIELDRARIDKHIQSQNIYYDSGKWDIRADAAERLNNVVTLMKDNPGIFVELGSHTDSRGNDDYNQKLSQRRAASAVAYIVSKGVDNSRITARGYGEIQLMNSCRNGVDCSEESHQQNRRTELRITGISEKTSWKSLQQIIEEEAVAIKPKSGAKRLQEANTSVPLPEFKPATEDFTERDETAAPALPPRKRSDSKPARPISDTGKESGLRILPFPPKFNGCAIELTRSEVELSANSTVFKGQKEVFKLLENDGKFTYLLINLGTRKAASAFFKKKIKPFNKSALLVFYTADGKVYLSE